MSKDSRLTAAQWVACESYHDVMLKFVDRSGGDPGKELDGYDIYRMHVPKALVMADFPETQRQWLAHKANVGAAQTGAVTMSSGTFSDLVHMPDVIARTIREVLAMANAQHAKRPAHCLPRYGASAGTRPFMGRPNRAHGGLVGRIGGTLGAKGWKCGAPAKMKKQRYSGKKGALKKGKKARVDVAAVAVPIAGPSTAVEPKHEDTPFPETVAPGDVFMADYTRLEEEDDEMGLGWDGDLADSMIVYDFLQQETL
ncbi:hypothetical protein GGX14DRAFT_554375 [Mycena pura]|uniref:Uncharacterized protein n=1 Tax=Mycena pura TaxID=153505 RepID=A0AAD7E4Z4_9AGAR|nr:hypothetical protein GGX14DRAFT_554375 [Mycena pura]